MGSPGNELARPIVILDDAGQRLTHHDHCKKAIWLSKISSLIDLGQLLQDERSRHLQELGQSLEKLFYPSICNPIPDSMEVWCSISLA